MDICSIKHKKMTLIFILIFLTSMILTGCTTYTGNSTERYLNKYIEKNYIGLNLKDGDYIKDFSILDKDIRKHDVFLAGEAHGVKMNYDLQLELIKYLNNKADVRYILGEFGYSVGEHINKYLDTGDEKILEYVVKNSEGSIFGSNEFYEFLKKIQEYNTTIAEDKKIKFVGIDLEMKLSFAVDYLSSIISSKEKIASTPALIERFEKEKNSINSIENYDRFVDLLNLLQKDIEGNVSKYKKYLGDRYFDFCMVLDNIVVHVSTEKDSYHKIREKSIYDNFKEMYNVCQKGKFFGQFGDGHVYQENIMDYLYNNKRFGMYLNKGDSPVKDRVLSISYGYKDCYDNEHLSDENYGKEITPVNINNIDIIDIC